MNDEFSNVGGGGLNAAPQNLVNGPIEGLRSSTSTMETTASKGRSDNRPRIAEIVASLGGSDGAPMQLQVDGIRNDYGVFPAKQWCTTATELGTNKQLQKELVEANRWSQPISITPVRGDWRGDEGRPALLIVTIAGMPLGELHSRLSRLSLGPSVLISTDTIIQAIWLIDSPLSPRRWCEAATRLYARAGVHPEHICPAEPILLPYFKRVAFVGNGPRVEPIEVKHFAPERRFSIDALLGSLR